MRRRTWAFGSKSGVTYVVAVIGFRANLRHSLKNHGADELVEQMFAMGVETMALPMEEKMRYEQGDDGCSHGYDAGEAIRYLHLAHTHLSSYKAAGVNATDETGVLDTAEFINVSKDDALAWPEQVHRAYPSTVNARMVSTIKPFVERSLEVNTTLLAVLNAKLGLPEGTLAAKHMLKEHSGSEARVIRSPPMPAGSAPDKAALGSHTDFGSLVSCAYFRRGHLHSHPFSTPHSPSCTIDWAACRSWCLGRAPGNT